MKTNLPPAEDPELQIAPLIDCVFQLLIFFMVSASLVKSEADLGIQLPGRVEQVVEVDMPDEQTIEVRANGEVYLNGQLYGSPNKQALPDLVYTLKRYRLHSEAIGQKTMVTIWAEDDTKHQRIIDVMDACAAACIETLTFTSSVE
ncbi:MAG: ExbD/TolR family protein [Kiritimatiellia bacterium]